MSDEWTSPKAFLLLFAMIVAACLLFFYLRWEVREAAAKRDAELRLMLPSLDGGTFIGP